MYRGYRLRLYRRPLMIAPFMGTGLTLFILAWIFLPMNPYLSAFFLVSGFLLMVSSALFMFFFGMYFFAFRRNYRLMPQDYEVFPGEAVSVAYYDQGYNHRGPIYPPQHGPYPAAPVAPYPATQTYQAQPIPAEDASYTNYQKSAPSAQRPGYMAI